MNGTNHCASCKFFDDHTADNARAEQGVCRFNPPVSQPAADARGLWPVVGTADWCGHYAAGLTPAE